MSRLSEYIDDPDFFLIAKAVIESELANLKKIVDSVSQMRVQACCLQSDLMTIIDAGTWENISELIGLYVKLVDVTEKTNNIIIKTI